MSISSFDDLAATLTHVRQWETAEAQKALDDVLAATGGVLRRIDAAKLSERTGISARQFYRWRASGERTAAPATFDTFVEAIDELGASGFRFDDLALTMLYLLGGNMKRFRQEVIDAGYDMPSLPTLSRLWRSSVPPMVRAGAKTGLGSRHQHLFYVRHSAAAVDDTWQVDAFDLDVRVLIDDVRAAVSDDDDTEATAVSSDTAVAVDGRLREMTRPQLILLEDDHSRFITGWTLLDHAPRSEDTCALLVDAFEVRPAEDGSGVAIGGPCDRLVCDNASSFRSTIVEGALVGLGTQLAPTPAYAPTSKGKIERLGQTIQALIVTGLAGVVTQAQTRNGSDAFAVDAAHWLDFSQLEAVVADAVRRYNYETVHSALGATPFEVYSSRSGPRRHIPDSQLAAHYLPVARAGGRRKVQPTGVHVLNDYWLSAGLGAHRLGSDVYVRSLHHRLDRLAIFDEGGEFVTMVQPSGTLNETDRSDIVGDRIDATHAVGRHSAVARAVMEARTDLLASGDDPSLLEVAFDVHSEERFDPFSVTSVAPPGSMPILPPRVPLPTEPAPLGGPVARRALSTRRALGKRNSLRRNPELPAGGRANTPAPPPRQRAARPANKPIRNTSDPSHVPATAKPHRDLADAEAVLDAELGGPT